MFEDIIGKPYKKGGLGPDSYDCYGVCIEVCKRIGIDLPKQEDIIESEFKFIKNPQIGDLVLIEGFDTRHVGVMESNRRLLTIHSTGRLGVHSIALNHPWIKDRIKGFYRYEI